MTGVHLSEHRDVPGGKLRRRSGEGPACAQSAILVPVPEADVLVGKWRAVHDPKALTGVPAHITLVVPWLAPPQIKPEHLDALDQLLADQVSFAYLLDRVSWFGDRVLWLAPSPAEPFKRLTSLLASRFGTPPWQGEFKEVVPHLTVGLAGWAPAGGLPDAAADLSRKLPLRCQAREVDVMCGDGSHWEVLHRALLPAGELLTQPHSARP
ncbi:MAG: 2'-5' RNA ligase family protein [Acidimicrobiales bacterium]